MGCGKSKHAVETATTVIKSTNSDGTKHTTIATATKTVKETTTGSSLIQKETLSLQDTNQNPSPILVENIQPSRVLEDDVKVTDDDVAPTSGEVVGGDEKANHSSLAIVVPTSSKDDDAGTTVKEDEGKRESIAKTTNMVPLEEEKTKESSLTTDNKNKNEFLTPTLSEDVVGPFDVAKGNEEVKDVKTITNAKDDNLKVNEQGLLAQVSESTKVETKKEEEEEEVVETDIVKANISLPTETEKVPTANEANAEETQEKKHKTI